MPQPSSVTLMPIKSLEGLVVGDLIVFRKRLYKILSFPKQNNPESPSIQLDLVWGEPDDTKQGWRYVSTLVADGALKLTIN